MELNERVEVERLTAAYRAVDQLGALYEQLPEGVGTMQVPVEVIDAVLSVWADTITEYASERVNFGTELCLRSADESMRRAYPLRSWIEQRQRNGGKVFRRMVIVAQDWVQLEGGASA